MAVATLCVLTFPPAHGRRVGLVVVLVGAALCVVAGAVAEEAADRVSVRCGAVVGGQTVKAAPVDSGPKSTQA